MNRPSFRSRILWIAQLVTLWLPLHAGAVAEETGRSQLIQVGPGRTVKTIAEAAKLATTGSTVEVDAGEYAGDVAVWTQERVTLRAVGGRARLIASGAAAEGKAIWVVRSSQMTVEGFDFTGTQVRDRNGAGIRLESGRLQVRNCRFIDNENGILTSNNPHIELDIVDSEFAHNGYGDGQSHNLYAGTIAKLSVTGSHFHHAIVGHLLKSRAAVNDIRYNRLADGPGGRASYELEFASGGVAYVVGNIIEQSERTENPHLISFGTEGYRWPVNAIYLVHNTLIDRKPSGGVMLRVRPGDARITAVNNLLIGRSGLELSGPGDFRNNVKADLAVFLSSAQEEYRPRRDVHPVGKLVSVPASAEGVQLQPQSEYRYPIGTQALVGRPRSPGALQPHGSTSRP